jgi:hypothetical protein
MIKYYIESYEFGLIKVNQQIYKSDIIITPNRIIEDWWRKESHNLSSEDLTDIDWDDVSSVFIGTGFNGKMKADKSLISFLEEREMPIVIKPTPISVKEFNRNICNKKLGIFHITC